jgi:hypothetical protein
MCRPDGWVAGRLVWEMEMEGGGTTSNHNTSLLIIVQSTPRRPRRRHQQCRRSSLMTGIDCECPFISMHLFTVSTESLDVGLHMSLLPRPVQRYSVWEPDLSFPCLFTPKCPHSIHVLTIMTFAEYTN